MKTFIVSALLIISYPRVHATLVHVPPNLDPRTATVVIALHGCRQTPETMALGSGLNRDADARNAVVVYPAVPAGSHPQGCWSWYLPENQKPGIGQLGQVMGELRNVERSLKLTKPRVFVVGFSAGASLAANLLACYPRVFAGGVLHSGTAYGMATTKARAAAVMASGPRVPFVVNEQSPCDPREFAGRLLVLQGLEDRTVVSANVGPIVHQFFPTARSAPRVTAWANSSRYDWRDYYVGRPRARVIKVFSLGHAWSGTDSSVIPGQAGQLTVVPFFSVYGPNATQQTWSFIDEVAVEANADPG